MEKLYQENENHIDEHEIRRKKMIKKIYAHAKRVENNIKEEEIIKSNGKLNL